MTVAHLLNKINIVKSTILKLSPTTRESKVFTGQFNPILVPLNLCKLGTRNITVPYLQNGTKE